MDSVWAPFIGVIVVCVLMFVIAVNMIAYPPRYRRSKAERLTRSHWNDARQIAKLRHPSARADVYECWDPRCDCHDIQVLPYDWKRDPDLT